MELRLLKTESDYQNALKEIERLLDAEPNSPECDRLDILTTLVEAYEQKHYPIEAPNAMMSWDGCPEFELPAGDDLLPPKEEIF